MARLRLIPANEKRREARGVERCERFEELLSQRLDQPLLPEEERELEDHLARCPRCRALAEDLEQLCGQFACLEELPPRRALPRG